MNIGERLFKYQSFGRFAEYVCTAVIRRDKLTTYELECQQCAHGFKCRVLVKKIRNKDSYEFVAVVNDEDEEYRAWHTTHTLHEEFYPTVREARMKVYENAIGSKKGEIRQKQEAIERLQKELGELEAHYHNIVSASNPELGSGEPLKEAA